MGAMRPLSRSSRRRGTVRSTTFHGSIVLRLLTILETPPPMTVTNTTQTMHMAIMKQEKMKSVHATVFRPDGMTNASANTANSTHSSV